MDGSEDDQTLEWFPENTVVHLTAANDAPGYQEEEEEEEEEGDADREEEGEEGEDFFGFDEWNKSCWLKTSEKDFCGSEKRLG